MRIMARKTQVEGADPATYDQAAEVLSGKRGGLEAQNEEYEAWSDSTAGTRDIAGKAQKELERRGHQVPEWTPEEEEQPETETAEPEAGGRGAGGRSRASRRTGPEASETAPEAAA